MEEIQPLASTSGRSNSRMVHMSLHNLPPESPGRFSDISLIDPPRSDRHSTMLQLLQLYALRQLMSLCSHLQIDRGMIKVAG